MALISKAEFKTIAGISTAVHDSAIDLIVSGVTQFVEKYCNNKIQKMDNQQTPAVVNIIEYFNGDDIVDTIFLNNLLGVELVSFEYNTGQAYNPTWATVPTSEYINNTSDDGTIDLEVVRSGKKTYKVTYNAGYEDDNLPDDLKLAMLKLVGNYFNKRRSDGVATEGLDGANVSWEKHLSSDIKIILDKYKKYDF